MSKKTRVFETPIAIRAYSERPDRDPLGARPLSKDSEPSPWILTFDCETSIDAAQELRFGFYQVRKVELLKLEGIFFNPAALTPFECQLIRNYARSHGLDVMTIEAFRTDVFLKYGYTRCGTVVGFNLPFDISRIAMAHGPAMRHMRGGFSFHLTDDPYDPRVRVKHLSPRAALIDFGVPGDQDTPRGMRKRKLYIPAFRGHFIDLKTFGNALLSQRFSLRTLAEHLKTPTQKHETDEHGRLSREYLDYARADVQVTWECYVELTARYAQHGLNRLPDRLLSEASIGKAYLHEMGIKPFLGCDPGFSREVFGKIFCGYYGGRAEVHIRREIHECAYVDFKSMYPTVNSHMGLSEFVIADGMTWSDSTVQTRKFLATVKKDDLRKPGTWRELRTLVRLKPNDDILPTRAPYDDKTYTIGLNYLSSPWPLWFTLADCIAAKLLGDKTVAIEEAITFEPGPPQQDLQTVQILGREDYRVDPNTDDLFVRLIDLRDAAKERGDPIEKTLKIIANATSYGIFIEVNRDDAPKSEPLDVYGPDGKCVRTNTKAVEEPGRYFNALLGVLITGAARLMLAIAERTVLDAGLDWAFCDTDSLAIIRPPKMSRPTFRKRVHEVIESFVSLNPYRKPGSILKLEDVNFGIKSKSLEQLYVYAISAKRYALFNLDADGRPVLRKASAHGLGHLIDPYRDDDAPEHLPKPQVPLRELGVRRWQHDLWIKIIEAAIDGHPNQVALDWHPSFASPAASRYSASSPEMLRWLTKWNSDKPYREQIRPFGFLLVYTAKTGVFAPLLTEEGEEWDDDDFGPGRPPKEDEPRPIAPYDNDSVKALARAFDRVTGKPVKPERLKTYAEMLAQYHISPESKFENGQFRDRGRTERRHVIAESLVLIGKEANQVGPSGDADPITTAVQEFSSS
jgi:hypothetical protein